MRKKFIIIISILGVLAISLSLILSSKIKETKSKITIIDATYTCNQTEEKFYEDSKYVYFFPCVQSDSIFVKFKNGNKMLVKKALEENKVTIEELIKAGLNVVKKDK